MNTISMLWRKLLTLFLSFMLLSMNFAFDVQTMKFNLQNSVYAQQQQTTVVTGNTKGKSGTIQIEEANSNFLTDSSTALLVFIAAAIVIYKLATTCKPIDYDIYGAALGAGIFLMGELMSIFSSKNEIEAKTLSYKTRGEDGKIDDEQYQALLKEKELMDSIAKSADKRSKFQSAAAVVFGASALYSLTRDTKNLTLTGNCLTAAGSSICSPLVTPPLTQRLGLEEVPQMSMVKKPALIGFDTTISAGTKACMSEAKALLVAAQAAVPVSTPAVQAAMIELNKTIAAESACSLAIVAKESSEPACVLSSNPLFGSTNLKSENNFVATILELVIPKADASGMTGLISGIAGAVAGYYVGQSMYINTFITTPRHRAILWGALGAYGYMVSNNTKKTSEEAKANGEKIQKILDMMDRSRGAVSVTSNNASNALGVTGGRQINLGSNLGNELGATMPCMNGSSGGVCRPAPFSTNSNFTGTGAMPTGLAPIFAAAGNLVNSTQGKNAVPDSGMGAIDTINSNQNAVAQGLKKAQDRLNDVLKKAGKKPKNFKAEQNGLLSQMQKRVKSDLAKNGLTPSMALGRMGVAPSIGDGKLEDAKDIGNKAIAQEEITPEGGQGINPDKSDFEFDFTNPEDTLAAHNAELEANAEAAAQEGEVKDDIIKDKGVSIFKVISIRYKKSYDRLLKEL